VQPRLGRGGYVPVSWSEVDVTVDQTRFVPDSRTTTVITFTGLSVKTLPSRRRGSAAALASPAG
jgi:hypothetical protein